MIIETPGMNVLRLAKVCFVYPEGQTFDAIYLDTGDKVRSVQLMSPFAGTDFGMTTGVPSPEREGWEENRLTHPERRDIVAVIGHISTMPICLGFLFPQVTHMAFTKSRDPNRMIERHPSDFVRTVSDGADMDMVHPANAFFRMGEGEGPDMLEGMDFDKRYKITRNKAKDVTITLQNGSQCSIKITKDKIELKNGPLSSITIYPDRIETKAPRVVEDTMIHTTVGIHTDSNGVHTGSS